MIVNFTVGNFLSFKDKKTLSFEATSIKELPENVIKYGGKRLLRSIVVYGANSSGKSNLLKALLKMIYMLYHSVKLNPEDELDQEPFLLSTETEKKPTFFEIDFFIEKRLFRFGFEYDNKKIISEWLFVQEKNTEKPLYIRENNNLIISHDFPEGDIKNIAVNDNRIFLSLISQLGGETSKNILNKLIGKILTVSGIDHQYLGELALEQFENPERKDKARVKFLKELNLGFQDYTIKRSNDDKKNELKTIHNKFDKNGKIVDKVLFDCKTQESEGTKKIVDLTVPILTSLQIEETNLVVIDELDAKLHPILTQEIIKLYNNSETNPYNAQLLFATHDTNLLSSDLFRRDQIWFTEKDDIEQTDLYCLADMKLPDGSKVRNDSNLEKNYIRGRYGAIPYITK